jgi:hypothetical protein
MEVNMIQTAPVIKSLLDSDPLATPEEKKAILNALRGNKSTRPKLISKKVAAEICDSSTKSIDRYSARGYLTPIRFSKRKLRFDEAEVIAFARNGIEGEVA